MKFNEFSQNVYANSNANKKQNSNSNNSSNRDVKRIYGGGKTFSFEQQMKLTKLTMFTLDVKIVFS